MKRNRSLEVHSGWGAVIALACILAGVPFTLAFMSAFTAGVVVEMVQWFFPRLGQCDFMDTIWTGLGAAVAVGYASLI